MRPDRAVRWPWGTTGAAAACGTAPWWTSVAVPRAGGPAGLPSGGSGVPVTGPAAHDTDGDGRPDTLVVDLPGGPSLWSDLDGDGLADRVDPAGPPPEPIAGLPAAVIDTAR